MNKREGEREKNSSWEASRRRWINRHVRGRGAASIRRWNAENARANKNMAQLKRAAKGRKRKRESLLARQRKRMKVLIESHNSQAEAAVALVVVEYILTRKGSWKPIHKEKGKARESYRCNVLLSGMDGWTDGWVGNQKKQEGELCFEKATRIYQQMGS